MTTAQQVTVAGIRRDPALSGVYLLSLAVQPGVVAANNFLTLFNPVGSSKVLSFGGIFLSSYGIGSVTATDPMRGFRITSHSGGTLAGAAEIAKFDTRMNNPTAELRYNNPTTSALGAALFNSPPPLGTGGIIAQFVHVVEAPPGAGTLSLLPGEGIVARTAAGDTDQLWNITMVWGESP